MDNVEKVRPFNQKEKGMNLIFCYGCGISVHHYCYGLDTPIEINKKFAMFICDHCEHAPKKEIDCSECKSESLYFN